MTAFSLSRSLILAQKARREPPAPPALSLASFCRFTSSACTSTTNALPASSPEPDTCKYKYEFSFWHLYQQESTCAVHPFAHTTTAFISAREHLRGAPIRPHHSRIYFSKRAHARCTHLPTPQPHLFQQESTCAVHPFAHTTTAFISAREHLRGAPIRPHHNRIARQPQSAQPPPSPLLPKDRSAKCTSHLKIVCSAYRAW